MRERITTEIQALQGAPPKSTGIYSGLHGGITLADLGDQIDSVKSDVASQLLRVNDRLKSVDDEISNLDLRISEVGNEVSNVCAAVSGC